MTTVNIVTLRQLQHIKDLVLGSEVEISEKSYENLLDVFMLNGLIKTRHAYNSIVVKPPQ